MAVYSTEVLSLKVFVVISSTDGIKTEYNETRLPTRIAALRHIKSSGGSDPTFRKAPAKTLLPAAETAYSEIPKMLAAAPKFGTRRVLRSLGH